MALPRGKHTYGPEENILGHPSILEGSTIGKFCSIADNLQLVVKSKKNID